LKRTFRSPGWLRAALGVASAVLIAGFLFEMHRSGISLSAAGVGAVALFATGGFVDALLTRVELTDDSAVIVANFRKRVVPRAEIESVTWERGCGVGLRLTGDRFAQLPDVGNSQGRANSIRAWLKR
jgi:hypothetical protein